MPGIFLSWSMFENCFLQEVCFALKDLLKGLVDTAVCVDCLEGKSHSQAYRCRNKCSNKFQRVSEFSWDRKLQARKRKITQSAPENKKIRIKI